jgi:hypothetical protein
MEQKNNNHLSITNINANSLELVHSLDTWFYKVQLDGGSDDGALIGKGYERVVMMERRINDFS